MRILIDLLQANHAFKIVPRGYFLQGANMTPMNQGQLDKRLEAIHDAVKRTRSAFLLCILVPGAMFLCLWNTYASWDRDFAFLDKGDFPELFDKPSHKLSIDEIVQKIKDKAPLYDSTNKEISLDDIMNKAWKRHIDMLPAAIHDHQMRSWIETQVVAITLLGIKISVSDFAIVGSLALILCNFYSLLSLRRENHAIGYLFQDIHDKMEEFGYHAFALVSSYMVFNLSGTHRFGRTDGPIKFLNKKNNPVRKIPFIRPGAYVLHFLPVLPIFLTMVCDFGWTHMTYTPGHGHQFFVSAFRPQVGQPTPYAAFEIGEKIYFWIAETFALFAAVTAFFMTRAGIKYEDGTRCLLDEVYKELCSKHGLEPEWPETAEGTNPPKTPIGPSGSNSQNVERGRATGV
jgi:hypothetical protein